MSFFTFFSCTTTTALMSKAVSTGGLLLTNNNNESKHLSAHQKCGTSKDEKGVQLVLSSDSFVSSTLPRSSNSQKPIHTILTVQEKLAQDLTSLPPQVFILTMD
jgi:hypothetical protein